MKPARKVKKRAEKALRDHKEIMQRARKDKDADAEAVEKAEALAAAVEKELSGDGGEALGQAVESLEEHLDAELSRHRPNQVWEITKSLAVALLIALLIRATIAEPFRIPSGSMIPTLLVGDQLFVNKTVFGPDLLLPYLDPDLDRLELEAAPRFQVGLGKRNLVFAFRKLWVRRLPRRGEVVVFRPTGFPDAQSDDLIKRVIGLPGDKVAIRDGRLYINGEIQPEQDVGRYDGPRGEGGCASFELFDEELMSEPENLVHPVLHCAPRLRSRPFYEYGPVTVPEHMLFMMGDNRDRSSDSRFWGFVPVSHLKGTAMFIHLPLDPEHHYMPRWDRFFKRVR